MTPESVRFVSRLVSWATYEEGDWGNLNLSGTVSDDQYPSRISSHTTESQNGTITTKIPGGERKRRPPNQSDPQFLFWFHNTLWIKVMFRDGVRTYVTDRTGHKLQCNIDRWHCYTLKAWHRELHSSFSFVEYCVFVLLAWVSNATPMETDLRKPSTSEMFWIFSVRPIE